MIIKKKNYIFSCEMKNIYKIYPGLALVAVIALEQSEAILTADSREGASNRYEYTLSPRGE